MWVSKPEWDRLNRRVETLEKYAGPKEIEVATSRSSAVMNGGVVTLSYRSPISRPIESVIRDILNHCGIHYVETPGKVTLEKKTKRK